MKTKIVTTHEFEISDFELQGIILNHLAAKNGITLHAEDRTRISFTDNAVILTLTKREYKKS